ncbi:MAG: phosphate acyltransferase PlsX [Candidatus Cloacimonetes bacterium]|nr:phosphate acyltransferase PlsX [Candidatus Cloacimonadota bacterium]MDD4155974.1 phosphate acyltransferase PlsX [Candidatus Cloacimonadota bacterium]
MKIALDAFGSDNAPFPEVEGAVMAVVEEICDKIYLVGNKEILERELDKYIYPKDKIEVVHTSEVISMEDNASTAARNKQDSSMVKALQLNKEGVVDATLSVGNTGAVMAASLFTLGRIKNVFRPAIAISFPTISGQEIVLDVGANVDCEAEYLNQFAVIGSLYAKFLFNIEKPKVALLNIGEESKKGNELTKNVYKLLQDNNYINFCGNIEGKDLLKGVTDVVVCDGFVGNVMLKTVEGVAIAIFDMMKEQMRKDWIAKIGAMLSYPVFKYIKKKLDHSEYGGALLVGLNGISVVGHGRSNAIAIKNALKFTSRIAASDFIKQMKDYFERN